jgi:probable rRNA maturation factor
MTLQFINQTNKRIPRQYLQQLFVQIESKLISRKLGMKFWHLELGLIFLDEKAARRLNKLYRGKNYATDVLSFEGDYTESVGELIFCPKVIERQAKEHQLSYRDELAYLCIHGLLHLFGFDHEQGGAPARRMYQLQDWLFEDLCQKGDPVKSR